MLVLSTMIALATAPALAEIRPVWVIDMEVSELLRLLQFVVEIVVLRSEADAQRFDVVPQEL